MWVAIRASQSGSIIENSVAAAEADCGYNSLDATD